MMSYGVAMISRLLKILSLFCRMLSLLQGSLAKETCNFKARTHRSHPIHILSSRTMSILSVANDVAHDSPRHKQRRIWSHTHNRERCQTHIRIAHVANDVVHTLSSHMMSILYVANDVVYDVIHIFANNMIHIFSSHTTTSYTYSHRICRKRSHMGWLRWVGCLKIQVSLQNTGLFCRALLQKRPIFLSILLIVATPYRYSHHIRWALSTS